MSMWNYSTDKPDTGSKIEFVSRKDYSIVTGTWTGEHIQTADEQLMWKIVLYWRYV